MEENWKDVLEFEGLYQASNLGRIRSLFRYKIVLKPQKNSCGYLFVNLHYNGNVKKCFIHRLVYEAFNGKIPEGLVVNHIDENKENNRLDNLNLMSQKENINWGTRTQRVSKSLTNGFFSKSVLQFTLNWKFVRDWPSTMECQRHGFNNSNVGKCCNGLKKTYKGFIWMYADDFFRMLPEI